MNAEALSLAVGVLVAMLTAAILAVLHGRGRRGADTGSVAKHVSNLSIRAGAGGVPRTKISGMLYLGEESVPERVELDHSGGVPLCPLCGMPMEKICPIALERPSDIFIWRESGGPTRWRCYHNYPVIFVPER